MKIASGTSSGFSIFWFFGTSSGFGTNLLPKPEEVPKKTKTFLPKPEEVAKKNKKNKEFIIFRPGGLQDMIFFVVFGASSGFGIFWFLLVPLQVLARFYCCKSIMHEWLRAESIFLYEFLLKFN